MALSLLRACHRLQSTFRITRLFLNESVVLNRCGKTRLPPPPHVRPYSSDQGHKHEQKISGILSYLWFWFQCEIYSIVIMQNISYYDKEFNIKEFKVGAKQAIARVSRLISQCRFEALEGLVEKDMIEPLEKRCNQLSSDQKAFLLVDPINIVCTTLEDGGVYQDNDGRQFIRIVMHFFYLTNARIPSNIPFNRITNIGNWGQVAQTMGAASYGFQREITKGAPDWTIMKIKHFNILE